MKRTPLQQEHGQILVILVLALVGLLAFTALAIDVGMVFADRRYDQNVADSVALAGSAAASKTIIQAYQSDPGQLQGSTLEFTCPASNFNYATYTPPGPSWQNEWASIAMHDAFEAAQSRGTTNGYTLGPLFSEADFQAATEGIYVKCMKSINQEESGFYTYAKVTSTTQSSFAHFIFGGPLRNTVTAVALAKPYASIFGGYALISMDPDSCGNGNNNEGGIWFDGTGEVTIHDGGALSDTCMAKNGNTGSINLDGGEAEYFTGSQDCVQFYEITGYNADGTPIREPTCTDQAPAQVERVELEEPNCDGMPTYTVSNLGPSDVMEPGVYLNNVSVNGSNFHITMNPGLYCFKGDFTATANGASPNASLTGIGVTLYMENGLFSMTGQANYQLSSAYFGMNPMSTYYAAVDHHALPGFLLLYRYAQTEPDCQNANISNVKMEGSSQATYTGTIYAPCSQVDFGGTSDLVESTAQIIGNTIKLHGSPTTDLFYDASKMGMLSPEAELKH